MKALAWVLVFLGHFWSGIALHIAGQALRDDDFYQHTRQLADPDYHSPLHKLYGRTLYRWEPIRKLNEAADEIIKGFQAWKS